MGSACTSRKYVWARICAAGVTLGLLGLVGCGGPVDIPIDDCGSVMITGTSPDANNAVTEFITSDCRIVGVEAGATDGTFVITIDIAGDDGSTPKPRVLFTLEVAAEELPLGTPISLDRAGIDLETQLAPALARGPGAARSHRTTGRGRDETVVHARILRRLPSRNL